MRRFSTVTARPARAPRADPLRVATALRDAAAPPSAGDADAVPVALVPGTNSEGFPMATTPGGTPPTVPLAPARRRAFHAHLRRISAAAVAMDAPPQATSMERTPPIAAAEGVLLGAGCAMCGGRCCRTGGETAYLTPENVRRWLDAHPERSPEAAITAYGRHLPQSSVAGSCVYHTSAGCALPRELRSRTCNTYLCDGLTALHATYIARAEAGRPVRRAFLAVIEDDELARWGFVEAGDER